MPLLINIFPGPQPPLSPPPPQGPLVVRRKPQARKDMVVCPFCMKRFPVWELEFRSMSEDEDEINGYAKKVDEKYVTFWRDVRRPTQKEEQNFVLNISDVENVTEVCLWGDEDEWIPNTPENRAAFANQAIWKVKDKFGNQTHRRICPHCHNPLPNGIGRSPNYIISMMGNTSSGKTVYLSRLLLSILENGFLPKWGLFNNVIFTDPNAPTGPDARENLKKMFESRRADNKDKNTGKLADATRITYMYPIILEMKKGQETTLVTLFDFPGEAIWRLNGDQDPFFQTLMNRLNENASGWLFLLDSTTLPPVRNAVVANGDVEYLSQGNIDSPTLNADPRSVLMEFSNFFGGGNQIKAPVALVFSKADMITRYAGLLSGLGYQVGADSPFLCFPPHPNRSKVDLDDLWECHRGLQKFLEGDTVLAAADNLCRQYAWFSASATGVPVKAGQMGSESAPALRVVEPLEWLLWMLGAYAGEYTPGKNQLWGIQYADRR